VNIALRTLLKAAHCKQLRGDGTLICSATAGEVTADQRRAADEYLQKFLYSKDCWQVSLALLRAEEATPAEQHFCARALHVRLRCSVSKAEVRQASHESMSHEEWVETRNVLVALAQHWSRVPHGQAVLVQLCGAIAALACKMDSWDTREVVPFLHGAICGPESGLESVLATAMLLRALAEEVVTKALSIRPDRRAHVRSVLQGATLDVLRLLDQFWGAAVAQEHLNGAPAAAAAVLDAAAAWLDLWGGASLHAPPQVPLCPAPRVLVRLGGGHR